MSPAPPPTSTQLLARFLGGGKAANRLGAVALAVLLLTVVILVVTVWPLVRLRTEEARPIAAARADDPFLKEFDLSIEGDLAQIEGRSLFALPLPPAPPSETARTDSSKPARYGGPSVIAMINGKVWFSDGQRLGPGEAGKGTLKVISLDAPWATKVEWEGAEFDVEFYQRSPLLNASSVSAGSLEPVPRPAAALRRRAAAADRAPRPPASSPTPAMPEPAPLPPAEEPPASAEPGEEPYPPPPSPAPEPGTEPRPAPPSAPPSEPPPEPGTEPAPNPTPPAPPAPPAPSPEPEASRP